ncbi:MAG: hypothetical protein ACKV2T_10995 [Kofleriaceae bacterium]
MVPELAGWTVRHVTDGVALVPPDRAGGIRLLERQPLLAMRDAIAHASGQMDSFACEISPLERFTTHDGEYAATCTIVGRHGDVRLERTIGIVWGDHFCTRIDGATMDPAQHDRYRKAIDTLTRHHSLGLGEQRRRRYVYEPPPDWQGYTRGLVSLWLAPDYPRDPTVIYVFPARPARAADPSSHLDRQLHEMSWYGFEEQTSESAEELLTTYSLVGSLHSVTGRFHDGPSRALSVAILQDQRFHYVMRLEGPDGAHRSHFRTLVQSVEPVPTRTIQPSTFHLAWID